MFLHNLAAPMSSTMYTRRVYIIIWSRVMNEVNTIVTRQRMLAGRRSFDVRRFGSTHLCGLIVCDSVPRVHTMIRYRYDRLGGRQEASHDKRTVSILVIAEEKDGTLVVNGEWP